MPFAAFAAAFLLALVSFGGSQPVSAEDAPRALLSTALEGGATLAFDEELGRDWDDDDSSEAGRDSDDPGRFGDDDDDDGDSAHGPDDEWDPDEYGRSERA